MNIENENQQSQSKESLTREETDIIVYGTSWCGMSQMIRRYLDKNSIPYQYFELEDNPEAIRRLKWVTGGYAHHPTVIISGQALVEPSMEELKLVLGKNGLV